jgi:hypothetical protein
MTKEDRIAKARARVNEQRAWIQEHGQDLVGYIARYGSSSAPLEERHGDGGERIYEADKAELDKLLRELEALTK